MILVLIYSRQFINVMRSYYLFSIWKDKVPVQISVLKLQDQRSQLQKVALFSKRLINPQLL